MFLFIKKPVRFFMMIILSLTLIKFECWILFLYIWLTLNLLIFILIIKEWLPYIDMYFIGLWRIVLRLFCKWKILYFYLWSLRLLIHLLITFLLIKKGTLYLYLCRFTIIEKWFDYRFILLIKIGNLCIHYTLLLNNFIFAIYYTILSILLFCIIFLLLLYFSFWLT